MIGVVALWTVGTVLVSVIETVFVSSIVGLRQELLIVFLLGCCWQNWSLSKPTLPQLIPFSLSLYSKLSFRFLLKSKSLTLSLSLLNIDEPNELYGHPGAGNSWEGFTIEQIVTFLPSNLSAYYYRTHHGAEADLVLVKGIKPLTAIEIKLSNSPAISKGFYECVSDLKTQKNFIITPNSDDYLTKEKIHVCSLISFLKNHLPTIVKQK